MKKVARTKYIWNLFNLEKWNELTILDCASGDGRKGLQWYLKWGLKPGSIVAVDVIPNNLKILQALGVETLQINLEKERLCTKKQTMFDLILCIETLEHLTKKAEEYLLSDFINLLNSNGSLIIEFPIKVKMDKKIFGHKRQPNQNMIFEKLKDNFNISRKERINNSIIMVFMNKTT